MSTDKLAQWAESKFEGLDRKELREAGELLGVTFGPNSSERTMRLRLCEAIGDTPAEALVVEKKAAPAPRRAAHSAFEPKPNLTADGEWGGRKHTVIIFPQGEDSENSPKYVRLFHECQPRDYPYNKAIELPEPMYESLRLAERGMLNEREVRDSSGVLIRIDHVESKTPRYPHQYLGVVPETAHLPGSLREYWLRQAERTNNFEGVPRRVLMGIRADLYGPAGRDFYKDLTDQDVLFDILTFLGVDEYSEVV